MTVNDIFQFIKNGEDELQLNEEHGALLVIGVDTHIVGVLRGRGYNVISAVATAMQKDQGMADILTTAVRVYERWEKEDEKDPYRKVRKVFNELDKA